MRKTLDIFLILFIFFVIYFLQSNFFSWFNIVGIKPNLFIVLIVILGLFMQKEYGFIFGIIFGLMLDFFLGIRIGINTIALGIIGLSAGIADKNFSKDNKITLITLVGILSIIAEIIICFLEIIFLKAQISAMEFIRITLIEAIYNIILVIIVYSLVIKFGKKLENDFVKANNFLNFLY